MGVREEVHYGGRSTKVCVLTGVSALSIYKSESDLHAIDFAQVVGTAVEALSLFDHYEFRVLEAQAATAKPLVLQAPPKAPGDKPWFDEDYTVPYKIRDREIFA